VDTIIDSIYFSTSNKKIRPKHPKITWDQYPTIEYSYDKIRENQIPKKRGAEFKFQG
jgi:hypothetical protein